MNNYEYVNVENIKVGGTLDRQVKYKPYFAIVICAIAGVAICFMSGIWSKILGIFFIVMAGLVQYLIQDRVTMDIYDCGVVLYDSDDVSKATYLPYEEMAMFEGVSENGASSVKFTMANGQVFYKDTFVTGEVLRGLRKFIPKKEARVIREEENRKKGGLVFKNPFKK